MIKTYINSGVLISASNNPGPTGNRALLVLDDPNREFASSIFVKMEVLPKPVYFNRPIEERFYREFFKDAKYWAGASPDLRLPNFLKKFLQPKIEPFYIAGIVKEAELQAARYGLNAMDALHIAAALAVGCDEFVTSEKATSAIHRATSIKIVSIAS